MLASICSANAKCSCTLAADELQAVIRITEIGKHWVDDAFSHFVTSDPHGAVLQVYESDGTPARLTIYDRSHSTGCTRVFREGGRSVELLLQVIFARRFHAGRVISACRVLDAVPLTNGKSAKAIFATSLRFFRTIASYGHLGIGIEVKVFDRALFSALTLLYTQYHLYRQFQIHRMGSDVRLRYLCEWPIFVPCILHDLQNSQKWSLYHFYSEQGLIKDIHIGIESLRNGYDLLLKHLSKFIFDHLKFRPEADLPSEDILRQLWSALGAEPDILDYLVSHRVLWIDGGLNMLDSYAADPRLLEDLSASLLSLWKFRPFTDSRWMSLGRSSRPIAAGFLTGLGDFAVSIINNSAESSYFIGGFRRLLEPAAREFIATTAITSWVLDEAFEILLADDRMLKQLDLVRSALDDEVAFLGSIDIEVWDLLATICGPEMTGHQLRSDASAAAHIAYAFFWFRSLRRMEELPFSLTFGNIKQNLDTLVMQDEPEEPVAAKIWRLCNDRLFTRARIVAAIRLIREIPFSTRVVEQVHAYAAAACKFHARYGLEAVRCRGFVSLLNLLQPRPSSQEKVLHKVRGHLDRLHSRMRSKIGAKQLYVKDLMDVGATFRKSGRTTMPAAAHQRKIMAGSQRGFDRLSEVLKRYYSGQVRVAQAEAEAAKKDAIAECTGR